LKFGDTDDGSFSDVVEEVELFVKKIAINLQNINKVQELKSCHAHAFLEKYLDQQTACSAS
jgi:hypothetical protein